MVKHTANIESEWRNAARQFYNHLFMCPYCRPKLNAYCDEGGRLGEQYKKAVDQERKDGNV